MRRYQWLPMLELLCIESGFRKEAVFSEVQSNPTRQNVERGVGTFRVGQHDGVIASWVEARRSMLGKATAFLSGQDRPLWDFEDLQDNWTRANRGRQQRPLIALPTTAGTGAEAGRVSVITDTEEKRKRLIFHPHIPPSLAILDAELTLQFASALNRSNGNGCALPQSRGLTALQDFIQWPTALH